MLETRAADRNLYLVIKSNITEPVVSDETGAVHKGQDEQWRCRVGPALIKPWSSTAPRPQTIPNSLGTNTTVRILLQTCSWEPNSTGG